MDARNMAQGSAEWLAARRAGIGGSDIGALLGLSPWASPYDVWAAKVHGDTIEESDAMEWGKRLEPVIVNKWAEAHPEYTVTAPPAIIADPRHPVALASVDGLLTTGLAWDARTEPIGVLEIKTGSAPWKSPPPNYMAQLQWYLGVVGVDVGYFALLAQGRHFQSFTVEADPGWYAMAVDRAEQWWERYVIPKVEPPTQAPNDTAAVVSETVVAEVIAARERVKLAEAERDLAEKRLWAEMGAAPKAVLPDGRSVGSYQSFSRTTVSTAKLKEQYPEVWEACQTSSKSEFHKFTFRGAL